MRIPRSLAVGAVLGASLAGCGGGGEDALREVATLRAKNEAQAAETAELQKRVKDLETRSAALEVQVSSLALAPRGAAPGKPGAKPSGTGATADSPPASAESETKPAPSDTPSFLDSEEGKQKMREFLANEEKERQQKASQAMQEQMESAVRDRVTGYWTEQLGLDKKQQDALIAIAADATKKFAEMFQGMQGNRGDPTAFASMREKGQQIRQDALDQIAQTLTQDQNAKFKELGGENPGGLLGGRGMGGAAFGGRDAGGGQPTRVPR